MNRRTLLPVLGVAAFGLSTAVGSWRVARETCAPMVCGEPSVVSTSSAASPSSAPPAPPAGMPASGATDENPPGARPASARVTRVSVRNHLGYVSDAAPLAAPSPEHPRGTLVLAAVDGLVEVDVATGETVHVAQNPAGDRRAVLAATRSGLALSWDNVRVKVAFFDRELALVNAQEIGDRFAVGVGAEGDDVVLASQLPGEARRTFELVRFDAASGKRLATAQFPGFVAAMDEYPAQVVVRRGSVHLLVTAPKLEVQSFDYRLSRLGAARLASHYVDELGLPENPLTFGTMAPAGDGYFVDAGGGAYVGSARGGSPRRLPPHPSASHSHTRVAFDSSGRVLLSSGHWAESAEGPFEPVVENVGEQVLELTGWGEQIYADTPVNAFFVGERGVIVTQFPEVRLFCVEPAGR